MSTFLLGGGRGFCFIVLVIVAAALLVAMIITAMTMAMAVTVIVPHLSSGVYVIAWACRRGNVYARGGCMRLAATVYIWFAVGGSVRRHIMDSPAGPG